MQTLAVGNSAGGCFVFPDICGAVRTRRCGCGLTNLSKYRMIERQSKTPVLSENGGDVGIRQCIENGLSLPPAGDQTGLFQHTKLV